MRNRLKRGIGVLVCAGLVASGMTNPITGYEGVMRAEAAPERAVVDVTGEDVANAALKYLGYGYSQGSGRLTGDSYMDCTGLIYRALSDVGYSGMPDDTAEWISLITRQSLNVTYDGKATDVIYVDSAAQYNAIVDNDSYNNYFVVLKTSVTSDSADDLNMVPGTILIMGKTDTSAAHGMIAIGNVSDEGVAPLTVANYDTEYFKYIDSAMGELSEKYDTLKNRLDKAHYVVHTVATDNLVAGLRYMTTSNTYSYDTYLQTFGSNYYNAVRRDNYLIMPGGGANPTTNVYTVGLNTWFIDAASATYGVRLRNNITGKGNGVVPVYSIRVPCNEDYYAYVNLAKVISDNGQSAEGAGYVVTSNETLAKNVASGIVLESGIVTDDFTTLVTTGKSPVSSAAVLTGLSQSGTLYVAEYKAPENCTRDEGYYKVSVSGVLNTEGQGSYIEDVTYYASASSAQGSLLGNSMNSDGYFVRGGAGVAGTLYASDELKYKNMYGSFKAVKRDENGEVISVAGISFSVYDAAQNYIGNITTDQTGTATYPVFVREVLKTATSASETFYVRENADSLVSAGATGLICDDNYYKVTVGLGLRSDAGDCTVSVTKGQSMDNATAEVLASGTAFDVINTHRYVNAKLVVTKLDEETGEKVGAPIGFELYSDENCQNMIDIFYTSGGVGTYTFEPWKLNTDGSGSVRTIYMRENEESAKKAGLDVDTNIYKLGVTGAENIENCAVNVLAVTGDYSPRMNCDGGFSLSVYDKPVNISVVKNMDETARLAITEVVIELSAKVNGVSITPQNIGGEEVLTVLRLNSGNAFSAGFTDLRKYDENGMPISYEIAETEVVTKSGAGLEAFAEPVITREGASDYTANYSVYNQTLKFDGYLKLVKTDERGEACEAVFNIYADSACEELLKTVECVDGSAVVYVSDMFSEPWTYLTDLDGDKNLNTVTVYVKEASNDGRHILDESVRSVVIEASDVRGALGGTQETFINATRTLTVSKLDATGGVEVKGATLKLYSATKEGVITSDFYESWVSGSDGVDAEGKLKPHVVYGISEGYYVLQESDVPGGYLGASDILFYVSAEATQSVTMEDERPYGYVNIQKNDPDGAGIEGVRFLISRRDNGQTWEIETMEDGSAVSPHLPINELVDGRVTPIIYDIEEIYVPAGYILDDERHEVVFEYAGPSENLIRYDLNVVNEFQRGCIAVLKRGLMVEGVTLYETVFGVDVYKLGRRYTYLEGVEFTVYQDESLTEEVCKIVTSAEGLAKSEPLRVGHYYVKETKVPEGYASDLDENGNTRVYEFYIAGSAQDSQSGSIEYVLEVTGEIENRLLSATLQIVKIGIDEAGVKKPLSGVYFGVFAGEDIKNKNSGEVVVEADRCIAVIKTDSQGVATLTDTLPEGRYYYRELKTSGNEYVLDDEKVEFAVSYDDAQADICIEREALNTVKKGKMQIYKVSEENAPLEEAEFTLKNTQTGESVVLKTDKNGYACAENLTIGSYNEDGEFMYVTYTLCETKAPLGYELDDAVYEFTFEEGEVSIDALTKTYRIVNVKEDTPKPAAISTNISQTPFGIGDGGVAAGRYVYIAGLIMLLAALFYRRRRM
ncbi:MAG: Cna B-type domain-containing protein [Lachnospiraceae bacterium]|nr:Cna B-type domain-containing protein [Lachnospiraceae bacterium]